ncbi:MAG: hypothetical protein ABS81_02780 [Pseudonocardia sp. SCN 72-86]|nr:MAG: hypothetical protein ABS81_02780 [Pseudonocardia sp. SCN 72-86]
MSDRDVTLHLTSYEDVRAALYSPVFARADDLDRADFCVGNVLDNTINSLHGQSHRDRRRSEGRIFSQAHRWRLEHDVVVGATRRALERARESGSTRLNLIEFTRTIAILNAIRIVGIDVAIDAVDEQADLGNLARMFAAGAGVEESLRPRAELLADVQAALSRYDERYFRRSYDARVKLRRAEPDRPADDLIEALVALQEPMGISYEDILRETSFYMAAGSDTTTQSTTAVLHFVWNHAESPRDMAHDRAALQVWLHEALRLRTVVPTVSRRVMQDVTINGRDIPQGTKIHVDLHAGSTDPAVYGEDARDFNPARAVPDGVPRFGFAFSGGVHACLGKALAAGSPVQPGDDPDEQHLHGVVTVIASELLRAGITPVPGTEPSGDPLTRRWSRWVDYPAQLSAADEPVSA